MLYIKTQDHKGRGVFTDSIIHRDSLIERCPVIELPASQSPNIDATKLYEYYFGWGEDDEDVAIALGYGSLYNHSYCPNAVYIKNFAEHTIDFVALRDIAPDEEILVNYNGDPDDRKTLWKSEKIDWQE